MKWSSSRFLRFAVLLTCFSVAIVVRLSNYQFVFSNYTGHLNFIDTDCYYYLRRLVHFVSNFPNIMMFDPLSDWPKGAWVDWPEGFLLLLGLPLKLFGVSTFRELELGVTVIMLVLGLLCSVVTVLLAQRILKNFYLSLLVFFLVSVNFLLVRFSCLGQVDHHIMEAILPPTVLLLCDRVFSENRLSDAIGLGFVLAFSLLISSSSLFIIGTFFSLYAFIYGKRENQKPFFIVAAVFGALITSYAAWSVSIRGVAGSVTHPSYFHLLLIVTLVAASYVIMRLRSHLFWALPAVVAIFSIFYFLQWPLVLMQPLSGAISYVFNRVGILANVSEAAPIFMNFSDLNFDFMHLNFGYLIWILPLVWISLLFWRKWTNLERAFLLWLSFLSIPGIFQKRFAHLMVAGFLIFLVWLVMKIQERVRWRASLVGGLLSLAVLFATCLPLFQYGFSPMGSPRDRVDLGAAKYFLKAANVNEDEAWERLAGKRTAEGGVWANPNMGHLLTYVSGFPVTTNSFYHNDGIEADFDLRKTLSESDLRKKFSQYRIKYALLADDFIYLDMLYKMYGILDADVVRMEERNGRMASVVQMQTVEKYAWARILMQDWETVGFKRLFSVRFQEPHFYTFVKGIEFTGSE